MKTIIAALTLLALSSQANANDAVKQGIDGVLRCVAQVLEAAQGKPRVHPDAVVVAVRVCGMESARLQSAMVAAGLTAEERNIVAEGVAKMMMDAWATK